MKAYERLLNYVKVPTPSNEKSGTHPSSECQRVLADQLAEEMKALGVSDVRVEDKCYVYGKFRQQKDTKERQNWDLSHTWIRYLILQIMR